MELLLSTGIDVDHFDSVYGTALHVAATNGQDGSMNILLQHHADVSHHFLPSLLGCAKVNPGWFLKALSGFISSS